jgi:hypothetical protein
VGNSFKHRAPQDHAFLHAVPAEFVNRVALEHCGDLMRRFFPDAPLDVRHFLHSS